LLCPRILCHTQRQILHARSALRPISKNQYSLIRSMCYIYTAKKNWKNLSLSWNWRRTQTFFLRLLLGRALIGDKTDEMSDATVVGRSNKWEIMEIHFQKRNRDGLCRYWRRVRRPQTCACLVPLLANDQRRDDARQPRSSGARRRPPVRYRRLADTEHRRPDNRMAVGRGLTAVVLRVNTHCKT